MRASKRDHMLDAALVVVEHDGVAALTLESVAAQASVSKGGLLYHFATKEALMLALHERLAQLWSDELLAALGREPEAASATERLWAYISVSARKAAGPELRLMLEATSNPELDRPWKAVTSRWVPDPSALDTNDPAMLTMLVARLAAEGLWMADALSREPLSTDVRAAIASHIAGTLDR